MNITENNINRLSEKDNDQAQKVLALQDFMSSVKHKFLMMSSQRGVGKTSVIIHLAAALSKRGAAVGLMDINFHGPDIRRILGLEPALVSASDKPFIPVSSDDLKVASIESAMHPKDEGGVSVKPPSISDIRRFISHVKWGNLDYLFVDTPAGPGEALLAIIKAIPDAKKIIITVPNKIDGGRAKNMINFFRKEQIAIYGWIENMRGYFFQPYGQRLDLFSTGSGSRAVFLGGIPLLGRIPIDPHLLESADIERPSLEKYLESEVAKSFNIITEKIMLGDKSNLPDDRPVYRDL